MRELLFATLERELLAQRRFATKAEARMAIFEFIEGWYNPIRRSKPPVGQSALVQESGFRVDPNRIKGPKTAASVN